MLTCDFCARNPRRTWTLYEKSVREPGPFRCIRYVYDDAQENLNTENGHVLARGMWNVAVMRRLGLFRVGELYYIDTL